MSRRRHERRSSTTAGTSGRVVSTDHCSRWWSDVDDLDTIWATDILPRDHGVQCAFELVSSGGLVYHQTVAVDQKTELNRVRIVRTIEVNVKIANDVDRCLISSELF